MIIVRGKESALFGLKKQKPNKIKIFNRPDQNQQNQKENEIKLNKPKFSAEKTELIYTHFRLLFSPILYSF